MSGVAWAARDSDLEWSHFEHLLNLAPRILGLLFALVLGVFLSEMLRFRAFGTAIGVRIPWLATWDATVANFFFAWITPGAAMAEPATVYVLGRRGIPWDASALVCFGKSFTSFLVILGATLVLLFTPAAPQLHPALLIPFATGTAVLLVLAALVFLGVFWPERLIVWLEARQQGLASRRLFSGPRGAKALRIVAETVAGAIRRAGEFKRLGLLGWLGLLGVHLIYYGVFVGVLLVLARSFGASSVPEVIPAAIIYQGFTYVAPTPGGSGLSEATAESFFGHVLSPEASVLVVLLFRTITFYLHIGVGLVYLPLVGGVRAILERE